MNIQDVKNIIKDELENKLVISGTLQQIIKNKINRNIRRKLYDIYNEDFSVVELIYLLTNKDNLENLNIFCNCGNKNHFIGHLYSYQIHCCQKCAQTDTTVKRKRVNTFIINFGVDNPNKCKFVREKIENTKYKKCGYKCNWSSPDKKLNGKAKRKELYGVENCFSSKDPKLNGRFTCLKKYGYTNYAKTEKYKNLYKNNDWLSERQIKQYKTKSINKTFNTSKPEELLFNKLQSKFPDVIHHYSTDSRYPFECDFYIPSKDLFIELHFHWTHGKEPFNILNKNHIKILNNWKNKNTKFYKIAIEVWTKRDILKLKTFNNNKLNYKVFYNEDEFYEWFYKE